MFSLAILIGIYSYLIFSLGLLGILYKNYIIGFTVVYFLLCILWYRKSLSAICNVFFERRSKTTESRSYRNIFSTSPDSIGTSSNNKILFLCFLGLIFLQVFVNLIGALGPELAFDALWYHLTLPKIYLSHHSIFHVPGGLLYYSDMPKLTEMLYIAGLSFGNEILAKLIHFSFGILTIIALFKLSRIFSSRTLSMLVVAIFYANLIVAWQSITAYIDLARTFFEVMALWGFINWWKKGQKKWLIESVIMLGLAISVKLLAIGSLLIFTLLIAYHSVSKKRYKLNYLITNILVYWCLSLLVVLPWFVFSLINTGNPIYPFLTNIYPIKQLINSIVNPQKFFFDTWVLFTHADDPISPMYIITIPLLLIYFKKVDARIKLIVLYSLLALIVWYITPRTGGGRFILPYLPAFSILAVAVVETLNIKLIKRFIIVLVVIIALITIGYRGVANKKYIPVILGMQTKDEFLKNNLNFSFGDFYDTDGYFKRQIKSDDMVLIYGIHNLYYVSFPFIHESYVKKGDTFNYILSQHQELPKRFWYWNLIYQNDITHVRLYSAGGQTWMY